MAGIAYVLQAGCLAIVFGLWSVYAEVFSALADLEPLLDTQEAVINNIEDFIFSQRAKLQVLDIHLSIYKREHKKAMKDKLHYIGNPVNSFTLIKRLVNDLEFIEKIVQDQPEFSRNPALTYPTADDLAGAAEALHRLEDIYQLNITDITKGKLEGHFSHGNQPYTEYYTPISSSDCYELARVLYEDRKYEKAIRWLLEARRKHLSVKLEIYPVTMVDILEGLVHAHFGLKNIKGAMEWVEKLKVLKPDFDETVYLEEPKKKTDIASDSNVCKRKHVNYPSLCRGEMDIPDEIVKRLFCRYLTETHPFLRIAPIKMEQLYLDPEVYMLYEVVSDHEMEELIELAKPRLQRARVRNNSTGERMAVKTRISKTAWFHPEEYQVVDDVSMRVGDITGLNMDWAEKLQVANYGIGGQYEPHFDYIQNEKNLGVDGNRIATVLFYLSDVEQGGATVFTELDLTVFPVRGAAVFWYNLHSSGVGDKATKHAACPVLRGSKWAANKWLHIIGQEFIRPCRPGDQDAANRRQIPRSTLNRSET